MKIGTFLMFFLAFGSQVQAAGQVDCRDAEKVERFCLSKCESKSDEEGDGGGTLGHRSPKQYCYQHCPSANDCQEGTW